jgi:antitoxin HicB
MNKHTGSNFDDFLTEEGILEAVSAKADKRLLVLQLADIMEKAKRQLETIFKPSLPSR